MQRYKFPDNKVHGANMGPTLGRQDPGGPHVGPMKIVIWVKMVSWDAKCMSLTLVSMEYQKSQLA